MHTITETLKLQIYPTSKQTVIFEYSQQQFIKACQYASNYIFKHHVLNKFKLQEEIYHTLRNKFDLPAQIAICVIRATTSRYQTVQTRLKKEYVKYRDPYTGKWESYQKDLNHLVKPLQFKRPVLQLINNRSYAFLKNQTLSLGTLQGRQKVPFSYLDNKYFEKFKDWK